MKTTDSPYFIKKEEKQLILTTDLNIIKDLQNVDYFNWLNSIIKRDPNKWKQKYIPIDTTNEKNWPLNFVKTYNLLKFIRSKILSPVDTMGSSSIPINIATKCGVDMKNIPPNIYRFQILISVMLSSQTKDEMTALAVLNLTEHCQQLNSNTDQPFFGITPQLISQISTEKLDELIKCVGFHNRKATYIHNTTLNLINNYNSDVPTTLNEIMSLQGVGIKMATLVMQYGWGQINSICVDIHVHRLSNLLNWTNKEKCKNPNITRLELENWLPHELWGEINSLLVGIGQFIDRSRANRLKLIENLDPLKDDSLIQIINHMNNCLQFINYIKRLVNQDILEELICETRISTDKFIKKENDINLNQIKSEEIHLANIKTEVEVQQNIALEAAPIKEEQSMKQNHLLDETSNDPLTKFEN